MSRNVLLFLVPLVPLFFDKIEADLFFKIQFEIKMKYFEFQSMMMELNLHRNLQYTNKQNELRIAVKF